MLELSMAARGWHDRWTSWGWGGSSDTFIPLTDPLEAQRVGMTSQKNKQKENDDEEGSTRYGRNTQHGKSSTRKGNIPFVTACVAFSISEGGLAIP